jgi:hypothetical protein
MANNKFNNMKIFSNNNNSNVNKEILDSINRQKKTPNPLIKKVDSFNYSNVSNLIRNKIVKFDERKIDLIERTKDTIVVPETPMDEFLEKHNSTLEQLKIVSDKIEKNFEISNGEIKSSSINPDDLSYLLSGDANSLPKGKPVEPIYTFKQKPKSFIKSSFLYKISDNYTSIIMNKNKKSKINLRQSIISFKNKIFKKIEKFKFGFYNNILRILSKFSKFLYLQTLSKEQRESLKNMDFNPNSSDNSAIVKLILKKNFNVKELKEKVKKFEQIDSDRNNHLLFE